MNCKKLIILPFLFLTLIVSATNYYVKSGATGDTLTTIAQVNALSLVAGDSVFLCKGQIWRETLTISGSGSSGNNVYIGSFGTGNSPKILGSKTTTWTSVTGNVWQSDETYTNPKLLYPYYSDIWYDAEGIVTWGTVITDTASLVAEYQWTWLGDHIYIYATTDPDSKYTAVEIPQRQNCIETGDHEYLHFNGIDVHYSAYMGFDTYSLHTDHSYLGHCIIEYCDAGYIGGYSGTSAVGYGIAVVYHDLIVRHCNVHDCGRRSLSLDIYGSGFTLKNALIEDNTFYNGFHTTGVDISVGNGSYTASWDSVIIRRNLFYEASSSSLSLPKSNQIFLQNYDYAISGATMNNVFIYDNLFKYPRGTAINAEGIQSFQVYNNTFYEVNTLATTGYYAQVYINQTCTNVKFKNNILYNTNQYHTSGCGSAFVALTNTDYTEIEADYNIYYRSLAAGDLIQGNGTVNDMGDIATVRSALGWETHGQFIDPSFVNAPDSLQIDSSSPAYHAGVNVGLTSDYAENAWYSTPSIGAYEYNTSAPILVTSITISGAGGVTTITTKDGTLQMSATVLPEDVTNKTVTWSTISGTGSAGISSGGLLTALTDGTVTVRATATDGSGVYDDEVITISGQTVIGPHVPVFDELGRIIINDSGNIVTN